MAIVLGKKTVSSQYRFNHPAKNVRDFINRNTASCQKLRLLTSEKPTGAAAIIIDAKSGENSIIVVPGACLELTPEEVDDMTGVIGTSAVFVTQLELSLAA